MATCISCNRTLTFFETIGSLQTKRCPDCNTKFKDIQQRTLAINEQLFTDGGITREQEEMLYKHFTEAMMPPELAQPVIERLRYLRMLSEIRWGNIPRVATDIHLNSDEYAHFQMPTTYFKPNKNIKIVPGRLIGTNQKLYFLSSTGSNSVTIDWNNVSLIDQVRIPTQNRTMLPGVHITTSKGQGGGDYQVSDSLYTKIMMDTLVRIWKRQLVIYREQKSHGAVPDHVKRVVFQRDAGKCVQCGYEGPYIEYDHVIPRSKGGLNTVENIQLLCRMCNLKKGDRL